MPSFKGASLPKYRTGVSCISRRFFIRCATWEACICTQAFSMQRPLLCVHAQLLRPVWLWDPVDCSLPGSSVHGISQARILDWVTVSFPGDLPNPGLELTSPELTGGFFTIESPGKPHIHSRHAIYQNYYHCFYLAWMLTVFQIENWVYNTFVISFSLLT